MQLAQMTKNMQMLAMIDNIAPLFCILSINAWYWLMMINFIMQANVHRRVSSSAERGACSVFRRPGMLSSKNENCESRASESNFLYVLHQTSFSLKSTNNAARLPTTLGGMRKIHFCSSFTKQRSAFHQEIVFLNFSSQNAELQNQQFHIDILKEH